MDERGTGRSTAAGGGRVVAIVAVALNQRPAVVSVAPVLRDLRADTGLSAAMGGLLTAVPVLCFGAFAPFAPRLARRIGLETAVPLPPAPRGRHRAAPAPAGHPALRRQPARGGRHRPGQRA